MYEAGNGHEIWFCKEESMLDEWAAHGQPTCSIFGTVKTVPVCVKWTKNVHGVVCMRLVEINGLSCMRISRLMHKLEVFS